MGNNPPLKNIPTNIPIPPHITFSLSNPNPSSYIPSTLYYNPYTTIQTSNTRSFLFFFCFFKLLEVGGNKGKRVDGEKCLFSFGMGFRLGVERWDLEFGFYLEGEKKRKKSMLEFI